MNWLRKRLFRFAIKSVDLPQRPIILTEKGQPPEWTDEHAKAFSEFLESHLGRTFMRRLDAYEVQTNAWALCQLQLGRECAYVARGIQLARQFIELMAQYRKDDGREKELTGDEVDRILNHRINSAFDFNQ